MKPTLNQYEQHQLEMIDREIKRANLEMRLYCWVVMPLVFIFIAGAIIASL